MGKPQYLREATTLMEEVGWRVMEGILRETYDPKWAILERTLGEARV